MTTTNITTATTSGQTLRANDTLTLSSSGKITTSGVTVTWNLGTANMSPASINNAGTLQSTGGRVFDTSSSANGAQSISITNSGTILAATDVIRLQSSLSGGSITLANSGTITASNGRMINVQEYNALASFTLTNAAGAVMQSTNDTIRLTSATSGLAFTGTISIINSGTIKTVGAGSGQAIDLADVNNTGVASRVTITNNAGAIIEASDADALRAAANSTINNYGTIQGKNYNASSSGNDGIDAQSNAGVTVNNYAGGQIIGARHGITGTTPVTINNAGAITGQLGAGVNLDTASTSTTAITNSGTITGNASGSTDGDGVDVDGLVSIVNSGTIQALGHATVIPAGETTVPTNEAITVGGGSIVNTATGLIYSVERAITVDNSSGGNAYAATTITNAGTITGANGTAIVIIDNLGDTINNSGTINGSVTTGSGNDTVTNSGTINGALDTGAGADTVNWNSALLGNVNGGAGDDTVTFNASFNAASGSASFTGFEHVSGSITGTSGNDNLDLSALTASGSLSIHGGDGNDSIIGGAEDDTLLGGAGNDTLAGGTGQNTIDGGDGNDTAVFSGAMSSYTITRSGAVVTISDAHGSTTLTNVENVQFSDATYAIGVLANSAPAFTSASTFSVAENSKAVGVVTVTDDVIITGLTYSITGGADAALFQIDATTGALSFKTAPNYEAPTDTGADNVYDVIVSASDGALASSQNIAVTVTNVAEAVVLRAGAADSTLVGSDENDTLVGGAGHDTLIGGLGNDTLKGGASADTMTGGAGDDIYYVDNIGDLVIENAGEGNDRVYSSISYTLGDAVETLNLTGSDNLTGTGNALDNHITGNDGNNVLYGLDGKDTLAGGAGNDTLYGGAGNDTLQGGNGNDVLIGGAGANSLWGGAGADRFVFDVLETSVNKDAIGDFTSGEDKLAFDLSVFTSLSATGGVIDASNIAFGSYATTASQHLLYVASSGTLYYDADGVGGADRVLIAVLTSKPVLTAADFIAA
jgi:Ca2+-binding RTX toxin-like protein